MFLKEALEIIELGEDSKEIIISGLTENYCDKNQKLDAKIVLQIHDELMIECKEEECNDKNLVHIYLFSILSEMTLLSLYLFSINLSNTNFIIISIL